MLDRRKLINQNTRVHHTNVSTHCNYLPVSVSLFVSIIILCQHQSLKWGVQRVFLEERVSVCVMTLTANFDGRLKLEKVRLAATTVYEFLSHICIISNNKYI